MIAGGKLAVHSLQVLLRASYVRRHQRWPPRRAACSVARVRVLSIVTHALGYNHWQCTARVNDLVSASHLGGLSGGGGSMLVLVCAAPTRAANSVALFLRRLDLFGPRESRVGSSSPGLLQHARQHVQDALVRRVDRINAKPNVLGLHVDRSHHAQPHTIKLGIVRGSVGHVPRERNVPVSMTHDRFLRRAHQSIQGELLKQVQAHMFTVRSTGLN